jgi:hypothetical protein
LEESEELLLFREEFAAANGKRDLFISNNFCKQFCCNKQQEANNNIILYVANNFFETKILFGMIIFIRHFY